MKSTAALMIALILTAMALAAAPGVAKADYANWLSMSGPATVTGSLGSTLTISEVQSYHRGSLVPTWSITATNGAGLNVFDYIYGGSLSITGSTAILTGNIDDGTGSGKDFTATGSLSNYSVGNYYSWNIKFLSGLVGLENNDFSVVSGPFTGSLSVPGTPVYPTTGTFSMTVAAVPIPSTLVFFAPALLALVGIRKRLKRGPGQREGRTGYPL